MLQQCKSEAMYVGLVFVALAVSFKIVFFNSPLGDALRLAFAIFYGFVIPGYALMLYWRSQFGLAERIVIGSIAAVGIVSILNYYLGLIGWNINSQAAILPGLVALLAAFVCRLLEKKN